MIPCGVWAAVDEEFYERYGLTEPDDFYEQMEGKSFTEVAKLYLDAFPEIPFTLEELAARMDQDGI